MTQLVLLAGGEGLRFKNNHVDVPKPLAILQGRPLLGHVIDSFCSKTHITEVLVATGRHTDLIDVHLSRVELPAPTRVIDTGDGTETGGRLKRLTPHINKKPFFLAYSDGLTDCDFAALKTFHETVRKQVSMVITHPISQYGVVEINGSDVLRMQEKPLDDKTWVNAGFFILDPEVLGQISGDASSWENETLPMLVKSGQVAAYQHLGFWQSVDTWKDLLMAERQFPPRKAK